jgi:hypothetical protein
MGLLYRDSMLGYESQMVEKRASKTLGKKNPIGKRTAFYVMLSPDVIKEIKHYTVVDELPAWAILEEAAKEWIARRKTRKP